MVDWNTAVHRSAFSGSLASAATVGVASLLGRAEAGSGAAPINSVSHVLWGDKAALQNDVSMKYTLPGIVINQGAAVFWAAIYEKLFGDQQRPSRAFAGAAAIAAIAYVVDYYVVPRRLTPGYEMRLHPSRLAAIYSALALSLGLSSVVRERAPQLMSAWNRGRSMGFVK